MTRFTKPYTWLALVSLLVLTLDLNGDGYVYANCAEGSHVVGGGWGLERNHLNLQIFSSVATVNSWQVSAYNNDSSAHLLFGYAICLSGVDPFITVSHNQTQVPAGAKAAVATTRSSGILLGGGFADALNMSLYDDSPVYNAWWAGATNHTNSSQLLSSYALCSSRANATSQSVVQTRTVVAGATASFTVIYPAVAWRQHLADA